MCVVDGCARSMSAVQNDAANQPGVRAGGTGARGMSADEQDLLALDDNPFEAR